MKKSFARSFLIWLLSATGAFLPSTAPAAGDFETNPMAIGQHHDSDDSDDIDCANASTGFDVLYCALQDQELARQRRQMKWKQMQVTWTKDQRKSFARLTDLAGQWFEKAAENEDNPGAASSWNTYWQIDTVAYRWEEFSRLLDLVLQNRLVPFKNANPQDRAAYLRFTMRDMYCLLKKGVHPNDGVGEIGPRGMQQMQTLWDKYRQAWLNFYHAMYPGQTDALLNACLLQARINKWEGFVQENSFRHPHELIGPAERPSFSCDKTNNLTEKTICTDASLRKMDHDLEDAYQGTSTAILPCDPRRNHLVEEQRAWLRKRNDCGASVNCLKKIYQKRIDELGKRDYSFSLPVTPNPKKLKQIAEGIFEKYHCKNYGLNSLGEKFLGFDDQRLLTYYGHLNGKDFEVGLHNYLSKEDGPVLNVKVTAQLQ